MAERLQKWLSRAGVASRRQAESLITQGRIKVNGTVAVIGQQISGTEDIRLDDRLLRIKEALNRVLLYHKPFGEICTRDDPEGRRTVFDSLPVLSGSRLINVGRLDVTTSGVLLFTTDGDLANRLMHPSGHVQREYAVRVLGELNADVIARLLSGVELDDGTARFASIAEGGGEGANRWYRVIVSEGRNRIVRRMIEAVGGQVSRLMRVRFGTVLLPRDLRPGKFRWLTDDEVSRLETELPSR